MSREPDLAGSVIPSLLVRGKVKLAWGPEVMDYGVAEFGLRDPNGYFIGFTE